MLFGVMHTSSARKVTFHLLRFTAGTLTTLRPKIPDPELTDFELGGGVGREPVEALSARRRRRS